MAYIVHFACAGYLVSCEKKNTNLSGEYVSISQETENRCYIRKHIYYKPHKKGQN